MILRAVHMFHWKGGTSVDDWEFDKVQAKCYKSGEYFIWCFVQGGLKEPHHC